MRLIKNQKGGYTLIIENYIYVKKRNNHIMQTWRCVDRNCHGTAITDIYYQNNLDSFVLKNAHNHQPDYKKVIKMLSVCEMKDIMEKTKNSPRFVTNTVMKGADIQRIEAIGDYTYMHRRLRRYRSELINPLPYLSPQLKLSHKLCYTHINTPFYRYGPDNFNRLDINNDILLFFSDFAAEKLKQNSVWCVDGTFSVVPSPYLQLYTISCIKEHHVFPCIFAILKNKKKETYKKLHDLVRILIGNVTPLIIKTDFENSAIQAMKETYLNTRISGCAFHLGQAVFRRIQMLGLSSIYRSSFIVKKFTKALTALSYVRISELTATFYELYNHPEIPSQLIPLYDYFFTNYLRENPQSSYPPEIWHSSDLLDINIPRTNNGIEGWHNVFASGFGTSKFCLPLLFEKLKDEEDATRIKFYRFDLGHVFERKKKYIEMEERLMLYLNQCRENNYGINYIFGLVDLLFY